MHDIWFVLKIILQELVTCSKHNSMESGIYLRCLTTTTSFWKIPVIKEVSFTIFWIGTITLYQKG